MYQQGYKRRREYKSSSSYRRPYKRQRTSTGVTYRTVPRTRGIYGKGEMKYFDCEKESTALVNTTNWTNTELDPTLTPVINQFCLFAPTQGAAINQRIGREVKVYKIKIRGIISTDRQSGENSADNPVAIRLLLVQDTQTNGTQCQGEDVMQPPTTASANMAISSFQNYNNFGRFRVLKDKVITIQNPNIANNTNATGNLVVMGLTKTFKFSVKFKKPVSVRFNATNGVS